MTFHGTLSDINTAVATATYAANANFNGSDTIVFSVTDTFGGIVATGTGLAASDSDNVAVTVSAVNDPVSTNAPATATLNEDSVNFAVAGLSIADVDATLAPADVYDVTLAATQGVLTLTTLTGLTFTSGDGTTDTTMTFHGTLSDINTALATAKYSPNANYNGPAQISLQATDTFGGIVATGTGSATSDSDTINVTVTSLNDAPTVAPGGPLPYTENDPASGIMGGGGTVADVDSNDFAGGSLTVSFGANARAADQLSILTDSTILLNGTTVQYDADGAGGNAALDIGTITTNGANGANLVVSLNTSDATAAALTALIQHVAYANSSDNPIAELRLVTFSVNDGDGTANGGADTGSTSANLTVVAKNDAPVSTITPTSYSGTPNNPVDLKNNGLSVSDVDGNAGSETVTLSVTSGTLTVTAGTSGAGVAGSGTNSVQITGTIAQINDLLNTNATSTVSYVDTTGGSKTLTLAINDNGNTGTPPPGAQSAQDTANILIGEPPAVDLNGGGGGNNTTLGYIENDPATAIAPAGVTTDLDSPNYNGGSLTVHFSANGAAEDQLSILTDGTVTVSSGTVSVGGLAIGTVSGGANGADLVVSFNTTDATQSAVSTLIEHIGYANNSDNPSTAARTASFTINDGTGATGSADATINITAANDGPAASITPTSYSATEQTALDLKNNGLSVSDIDANAGNETVTLSVTEGILNVTAGTSGAVVNNSGTATVTITGTIAQINDLLNTNATSTVSYTDNTDTPSASATLTLLIHDNGNTGTGGDASASDTATINITAVNDAPVAVLATDPYPVTENATINIKNSSMSVSDVDAGPAAIVTATLSVTVGVLNITAGGSGAIVSNSGTNSVTISGTLSQINALLNTDGTSTVSYTESDDNPGVAGTLTLSINDGGATGTPGAQNGSDTSTIVIADVNDAPAATVTPTSYSATEQTALDLKNNGLSVSDIDGNAGNETVTLSVTEGILNVTAGTSGAIVNNSGTASVTITGTIAQINALLNTDGTSTVSYTDNTDAPSANTTLTLLIHDNGNSGAGGDLSSSDSATINIAAVNDAPVLTGLTDTPPFIENGASVLLDANSNAAVSDPELDAAGNYAGATLKLQRNGGPNAEDSFGATGTLDLVDSNGLGENVSLDGGTTFIGTFVDNGDGSISFTFNANATAADIDDVMRQIVYSNVSDNPPTVVPVDFIFNDGNGLPNGQAQGTGAGETIATVNVQVTQVNDRPIVTNVAVGAAYTIGSPGVVLSPALAVIDLDTGAPSSNLGLKTATVQIADGFVLGDQLFVNLPTSGGFFIVDDGGGPVVTNISVQSNSLGRLVLAGADTPLHYQLVLDTVSYRSTAIDPSNSGHNAFRTITWQVDDGAPVVGALLQTPAPVVAVGTSPQHVAAADINGDGALDLVTANEGTDNVSVLLGSLTTPGAFGAAVNFAAGTDARFIAVARLDGNATLDLAVADAGGGVSVLLGDGNGGFGAATSFAAGTSPIAVASADFNNDGKADLAVANNGSGNVSVLLGNGSGGFGAAVNFTTGTNPTAVTAGDFNRDGRADLAVANAGPDNVAILLGDGSGGFGAATTFTTGAGTDPRSVAAADFNGDGLLDLVTANQATGNVSVLLGNGSGGFGGPASFAAAPGSFNVAIADIDGDGKLDLAVANTSGSAAVLRGNGNGTFGAATAFAAGAGASGVALGDYNRDGGLDLAVANATPGNVSVLFNNGTNASNVGSTLLHFNVAPVVDLDPGAAGNDFTSTFVENGAGLPIANANVLITDPDNAALATATIVLTNAKPGDSLSILGALPGGIDSAINTSVPGQIALTLANAAALADYQTALSQIRFSNSSDNPDTTDRDITVAVNDGEFSGNTAHATIHVVRVNDAPTLDLDPGAAGSGFAVTDSQFGPVAIAKAPLIGDPDNTTMVSAIVVLTNRQAGDSLSVAGTLPGGIGAAVDTSVAGKITLTLSNAASLADYQTALSQVRFGSSDEANVGDRDITVVVNDGALNSNTTHATIHVVPAVPSGFNGDGQSDLVYHRGSDGTTLIQFISGNTGVGGGTIPNSAFNATWDIAGFGRFNGDNLSDLVYHRASDGLTEIQFLNGTIGVGGGLIANSAFDATWEVVGVGRFNGDNISDLVYHRASDGATAIQFLNGTTGVGGGLIANSAFDAAWKVAGVGDFNGDNLSDLVFHRASDGATAIQFLNGNVGIGGGTIANSAFNASFEVAGVGDFNGDNLSDLVYHRASDGLTAIQFLNGNVGIGGGTIANSAFDASFDVARVGDFNGDHLSDLVYHRASDGLTAIQFLNGNVGIGGGPTGTVFQDFLLV